ncbi:hypothetical protein GGI20_003164 [Coemansia sp. BCRC 34301]|nr:hypothetical protein GGI20_003164 [Coemansia sp. BCRC 34301]
MENALPSREQREQLVGLLSPAQKVFAEHSLDSEAKKLDVTPEAPGSELFPVMIRQVAGRGRGFFATRDIQAGETVFQAVPLASAISEDWMKNVCWWCFAYSARHSQPIKAMDASTRGNVQNGTGGRPRQPTARYKGAFCSTKCHHSAIAAHGGQANWDSYLALLVGMEEEIQQHGSKTTRLNKARTKLKSCSKALPDACQLNAGATMEPELSLPSEPNGKHINSNCLDTDFDPDDLTDCQLEEWISMVWDAITEHELFSDYMPDSSQRELIRLIANQLCLCDALATDWDGDVAVMDWQTEMAATSAAKRDIAPLKAFWHVKSNETEVLRTGLRQMQLGPSSLNECASTPATIAPIRLPWHPSSAQIVQSQWGSAFQVAAGSYSLLARAWGRAAKTNKLGVLSHTRFRSACYREKANSFGIWDPPTDALQLAQSPGYAGADVGTSCDEREWIGFSIYPTAVYFNHSCAPNIAKMRQNRVMNFVSNQSIRCGNELFISYGSITDPVSERRDRLHDHFFFECACERCIAESSVQLSNPSALFQGE